MRIKDFLADSDVMVDVRIADKTQLLRELAGRAALRLALDATTLTRLVLKREELGSTGVGAGIAIPHTRIAGLNKPFGLLVRLQKPLDFEAIDGQAVDVVFLLLLPQGQQDGESLNALAAVARRLRDPQALGDIRGGGDRLAVYRAMVAETDKAA
jgi:nitrogen PTS system EIIA component